MKEFVEREINQELETSTKGKAEAEQLRAADDRCPYLRAGVGGKVGAGVGGGVGGIIGAAVGCSPIANLSSSSSMLQRRDCTTVI